MDMGGIQLEHIMTIDKKWKRLQGCLMERDILYLVLKFAMEKYQHCLFVIKEL